jgi:hypothetical protein
MDGSGSNDLLTNAVVAHTSGNGSVAMWNPNTPSAGSNHACSLLTAVSTSFSAGPCTGISQANGDAACCVSSGGNAALVAYNNSAGATYATYAPFGGGGMQTGDYLAIVRTSATTFQCWWCGTIRANGCNEPTDWEQLVPTSGTETISGITDPGLTGIYTDSVFWTIDAWGAGNGVTLPAPNACAPNS